MFVYKLHKARRVLTLTSDFFILDTENWSSHESTASLFSPIRTRLGFMFPDKAKMVRNANALLLVLAVAPVAYLVVAAPLTFGKGGLARDPSIIPVLFYGFVVVSLVNIGTMVFFQTSKSIMSERGRYDPVGRTYLVMSTGAVLSEAHAIYGLVLTLLSGSIFYTIGFSLVAWACLWWVRDRFKINLGKLPNA